MQQIQPPLPPLYFISYKEREREREQEKQLVTKPPSSPPLPSLTPMPSWVFEEFISLANECIFKTFLEKHNNDLILIGGQAVFANIHPLTTLVQTTDIDVVVRNCVSPTLLNDWFDELEKSILKSWKDWTSTDGSVVYQSQDRDFIAMSHRYMYPRFQYKGFNTSIKLERWMHVHNGICTTSIKASNRRLLDVSLYPAAENNDLWDSSFLKWTPCPSLRIYNMRKCFSKKHTLEYGRLYSQVRIPNTRNLIQLLKKSTTLEAYGSDFNVSKRCFASSKVFQSMERIRLLEMVQQLKLRERTRKQATRTTPTPITTTKSRKMLEPLTLLEPSNFVQIKEEEEERKKVPLPVCLYSPVSISEKTIYTYTVPKKEKEKVTEKKQGKKREKVVDEEKIHNEQQFLYDLIREKRKLIQERNELEQEKQEKKEESDFEEAKEDYDFFSTLFFYMLVTKFLLACYKKIKLKKKIKFKKKKMSIVRLDKDSFAFGRDDDKDTYAEFFENEAKSSTRSRVQNFYRPEITSGPLTEFINPKSRTARSDQKYEALYRRLLDVCLLFFQEVRSMSTQIANLQNKTTESVYHVCLKDILNWKKDTVDYWKVKCIARHKDFEYTFRLAFKKFMTDFYDDDDVFDVNINTGIVIPSGGADKKNKSKTPTIFYNIPDVGDFFYNVICFMTQLPDVKSTKVLTNQTSLESCVYHSMNESMLQMSKDVIRTMESREMVGSYGFIGGSSGEYDISDSVSVASKTSKQSKQSRQSSKIKKKSSKYSYSPPQFYHTSNPQTLALQQSAHALQPALQQSAHALQPALQQSAHALQLQPALQLTHSLQSQSVDLQQSGDDYGSVLRLKW